MQEDTPVFLEDSQVIPKEKLMLQIAECLNKLHEAGTTNLDMRKASNQLSVYMKREDSLEIFLQIIVQSNSESKKILNFF